MRKVGLATPYTIDHNIMSVGNVDVRHLLCGRITLIDAQAAYAHLLHGIDEREVGLARCIHAHAQWLCDEDSITTHILHFDDLSARAPSPIRIHQIGIVGHDTQHCTALGLKACACNECIATT